MKKNLLLTCLLTLIAAFGVKANDSWPITLTKADGLPGTLGTTYYTYKSPTYTFDEAVTTLRITVCETNTSGYSNSLTGFNGRATWGPGFPYFSLGELRVFNAETNEEVAYTPTSNAVAPGDGSLEGLYDKNSATHFHTVYSRGEIDQNYHYVELEIESSDLYSFRFEWDTRNGYHLNLPTYIGLTPGTPYFPMPEQKLSIEKVTSVEELAVEGALFVIEGHSEDYADTDRERTNIGGGFFEAPCLATAEPSPFGIFYLIPVQGKENTYKVAYLNHEHYIVKQRRVGTGFVEWTNLEANAAEITFKPSPDVEGDFMLTTLDDSVIYHQDALVRMGYIADSVKTKPVRPIATNFSIYRATIDGNTVAYQLQDVIDIAEARIASYGEMPDYDEGQYAAIVEAVASAKEILAGDVKAADVISAKSNLYAKIADYAAISLYSWIDSAMWIIDAMEDEIILTSSAPNWVNGSYPANSDEALQVAIDNADLLIENYKNLKEVDNCIANMQKVITDFWASEISNVKSLPFRIGQDSDSLPGVIGDYGGYVWESPLFYLTEEVDQLRFTVFKTNSANAYKGYHFPTLAEFELYDAAGNKIELTEEDVYVNSVNPNDGAGVAGMLDGNTSTYYHGVYGEANDLNNWNENPEYVYFDILLPEPIGAFKYIQKGRVYSTTVRKNTPVDFVFGYYGESVTPEDVLFPDDNNAVRGSKVESIEEITDNGFYAIYGLLGCDPVNGSEQTGGFFTSNSRWAGPLQSPCAFTIKSTGDGDGTYYIQSLADGKYWESSRTNAPDYWTSSNATIYKSNAAKVKIEPNNNDGLPNSFVIYEYIEEAYRELDGEETNAPYVIAQDWGDGLGWFNVPSLDMNDKDGEGEWYIYNMSLDTPYNYWLTNLVKSANAMGLTESNDPGLYSDLGTFPETLAQAQDIIEANDEAASKDMIRKIGDVIDELRTASVNPVVEGIYVIEANNPAFFEQQKVKKAIYFMEPHTCGEYCGEIEIGWRTTPENIMEADSMFLVEFIRAAEDDSIVKTWLEDSLITVDQVKDAYYLKSVKYGTYITHPDPYANGFTSMRSNHLCSSETPAHPYMIVNRSGASFDIWLPGGGELEASDAGNLTFHLQDHGSGGGVAGHVVYWNRGDANSQWNLRLVSSNTTSIGSVTVEGDEVVSTTYYNTTGTASATPVKGVNIVKRVYANGVVKSEKIFVK